jgi:hypothetical protein
MARAAFESFGARAASIEYADMVHVLDAHPDIAMRNAHVRQKAVGEG